MNGEFKNEYLASTPCPVMLDVTDDGNCLPRSLSVASGRPESEYSKVKHLISEEYIINETFYLKSFNRKEYKISCMRSKTDTVLMSSSDILAFSNRVNRVVCLHLPTIKMKSVGSAATFLPWRRIDNGDFKCFSDEKIHISWSCASGAFHFIALIN